MDRPVLLHSSLLAGLGIPHAFSTRKGGVSTGMFESLNFGNPGELEGRDRDQPATIAANIERVLIELGLSGREVVQVHQVHADGVLTVRAKTQAHGESTTKADAIVTDDPTRAVAVRVADCVPILLATEDGAIVAAVHAGWRGVIAGTVLRALEDMVALGAASSRVVAAIGPCIGAGAFEVGPEVVAEFRRVFGGQTAHVRPVNTSIDSKALVDMQGALREQLTVAGVSRIDVLETCTVGNRELFFSHRRDRGMTGRMIGIIGPRDRT